MNASPSTEQILFLIRRIINEITSQPEKTKVTSEEIGMATIGIEIDAYPGDYSKILGASTDHLRAMKTICKLISDRTGKSIELSLKRMEERVENDPMPEFIPRNDWRKDHIQAITEDMFGMIVEGPYRVIVTDGKQSKTAIDVVVSSMVPPHTVSWIKIKIQPLYKSMGLKNGRIIAFNIMQDDQMLEKLMRGSSPANALGLNGR